MLRRLQQPKAGEIVPKISAVTGQEAICLETGVRPDQKIREDMMRRSSPPQIAIIALSGQQCRFAGHGIILQLDVSQELADAPLVARTPRAAGVSSWRVIRVRTSCHPAYSTCHPPYAEDIGTFPG